MEVERQKHLGVAPYERSPDRRGQANGYKPKTAATRMGEITFAVPQVREGGFYPQALEKGLRSERALKLALAEMYVQGVSTRKVGHQRRMRTTNGLERLTREIRRRSRTAMLFPNEASCLRLVTAVVMEISEDWQTGRVYLRLDAD